MTVAFVLIRWGVFFSTHPVKMTPEELLNRYPNLDFMMAETLLMADANGTLAAYMEDVDVNQSRQEIVQTTVTVEHPNLKCKEDMQTCEETDPN